MRRVGWLLLLCPLLLTAGCELLFPTPTGPEISCVEVESGYCNEIVVTLLASPPAGHGEVEAVVVRCRTNPPCAADRLKSEGIAVVTMEDGFVWEQGFGPQVGT